jgi:hypothetical protein
VKLTEAQADLLERAGIRPNALVNGDEGDPQWWIDGGFSAKSHVAKSLVRKGLVELTGREGGHPGVLFYSITPAGRAALEQSKEK